MNTSLEIKSRKKLSKLNGKVIHSQASTSSLNAKPFVRRKQSSIHESCESFKNISFNSPKNNDLLNSAGKKQNGKVFFPQNTKIKNTLSSSENFQNNNKTKTRFDYKNNQTLRKTCSEYILDSLKSTSSNKNCLVELSSENIKFDFTKIFEEMMEIKHQNHKLVNEIELLNSKVKSYKNIIQMKNQEIDIINKKHKEVFGQIKKEIENSHKIHSENFKIKEMHKKHCLVLKSTISILLEILDLFLTQKPSPLNNQRSFSAHQGDTPSNNSIDIYESYINNNEDEKRSVLVDQIQTLLIKKISYIQDLVKFDFDKEIQKIKSWNSNGKPSQDVSISNISNMKNSLKKDASMSSSESNNKLNQFNSFDFDLSVSNVYHSPKFYKDNSLMGKENLSFNDSKMNMKDEKINITINESLSLQMGQSRKSLIESFEDKKQVSLKHEQVKLGSNSKNSLRKSYHSFTSNKNKEKNGKLYLDLNDNPTDFNAEMFLSMKKENNSFSNNNSSGPVILSPIFGNKIEVTNLSFMD